jgi:L-alanine-DL-glutamate epimerase-like enolase superfamily enzyme
VLNTRDLAAEDEGLSAWARRRRSRSHGRDRGAVMTPCASWEFWQKDPFDIAESSAVRGTDRLFPSAMAAIDMALYDSWERAWGCPYPAHRRKGAEGARLYPVFPLDSPDVMAETARGFRALGAAGKVKGRRIPRRICGGSRRSGAPRGTR